MAVLTGLAFAAATVVLVLAIYGATRWICMRWVEEESRDLAGSVVFRVSALHGLILALVFAQETVSHHNLDRETVREASALSDLYYDIVRHGSDQTDAMQAALRAYGETVVATEWDDLSRTGRLSTEAWGHWGQIYEIILDLPVDTPRQSALRDNMLDDIDTVAQMRDSRESHAVSTQLAPFWFAAISGIVLISVAYFYFAPTVLHLMLLSIFGAYTGIVLFLIYAFSDPFQAPGELEPRAIVLFLSDTAP